MDLLFSAPYAPFSAALIGLAILGILELATLLFAGAGLSDLTDMVLDTQALPESSLTNWLLLKDLPLSVVLMLAFGGFGIAGFALQSALVALQGSPAPALLSLPLAALAAVAFVNRVGRLLRPLFAGSSAAVTEASLIGSLGVLLSPKALRGYAGEAKVLDQHGHAHFFMVEPLHDTDEVQQGEEVRLISQQGALFLVQPVNR